MKYTREDIERIVDEEDIEFIRLQFTDIFGKLKNVAITRANLEKALDNRFLFDGTYVDGFDSNEENEMFLVPDLDTFNIFPWRPQHGKVARLICDVKTTDGKLLEGSPRQVLKRVIEDAAKQGYTCDVGPECEFFLFQTDDMGRPTTESAEDGGYMDLGHSDRGENVRRDMVFALEDMGFDIESSYHEKGRGQHEIDFKYKDALGAADDIMTFKLAVKNIAKKHGLLATFMPKPVQGVVGSGMHINLSLRKDGDDIFYDESDPNGLSSIGYSFMAGILDHVKGMALITNPTVNSYKRLAGGNYVPHYVSYATKGKGSVVRVPYFKSSDNARVELKSADCLCNPYLAIAVLLAAGLDGINRGADCTRYMADKAFDELPMTLADAIREFQKDEFVREIVGDTISNGYIIQKSIEADEFRRYVSQWELDMYLTR